jgi:peptidoglycan-associated lipoprotein
MKRTILTVFISVAALLALLVSGCATKQMSSAQISALDSIAAKIAEAEAMGARNCAPKELAQAQVALDHARHELSERHSDDEEAVYIRTAEMAADRLLAKTRPCYEAMQMKDAMASEMAATRAPKLEESETLTDVGEPESIMASFSPIYFDFDKSFIRDDAKPVLEDLAATLKADSRLELVTLEGHCDERGTSEYNMALGQRRATAAMRYLSNLGVNPDRLKTISYGEERPADPGHNKAAWALNRRVELVVNN